MKAMHTVDLQTADGYDVHALMDLAGTYNEILDKSAVEYMKQGDVIISSSYAAFCQIIFDNARPVANEFYRAFGRSALELHHELIEP